MKSKYLHILWCLVVAITFNGCLTTTEKEVLPVLTNTWGRDTASESLTLKLRGDRSYEIKFDVGKKVIVGDYIDSSRHLTFREVDPNTSLSCREPGVYEFYISMSGLHIKSVADPCNERINVLSGLWVQKNENWNL